MHLNPRKLSRQYINCYKFVSVKATVTGQQQSQQSKTKQSNYIIITYKAHTHADISEIWVIVFM